MNNLINNNIIIISNPSIPDLFMEIGWVSLPSVLKEEDEYRPSIPHLTREVAQGWDWDECPNGLVHKVEYRPSIPHLTREVAQGWDWDEYPNGLVHKDEYRPSIPHLTREIAQGWDWDEYPNGLPTLVSEINKGSDCYSLPVIFRDIGKNCEYQSFPDLQIPEGWDWSEYADVL
jgi:hypothetical protein